MRGDMVIGVIREPKMGLTESIRQQTRVEDIIKKFPQVSNVFSRLGTPESATDPMGVNFADTFVILKKDQEGSLSKEALFNQIKAAIEIEYPGQEISSTQPIEMRFNELLEGSRADITLRIIGPDLKKLVDYVLRAETALAKLEGIESVEFDPLTALTKSRVLSLKPRPSELLKYNLSLDKVNELFGTALKGKEVGSLRELGYRIPVVLHLDENLRRK